MTEEATLQSHCRRMGSTKAHNVATLQQVTKGWIDAVVWIDAHMPCLEMEESIFSAHTVIDEHFRIRGRSGKTTRSQPGQCFRAGRQRSATKRRTILFNGVALQNQMHRRAAAIITTALDVMELRVAHTFPAEQEDLETQKMWIGHGQ